MLRRISSLVLFVFLLSTIHYAQTNPPTNLTAALVNSTMHISVELSWQYDSTNAPVKFNVYKKLGAVADTGNFFKIFSGYNNFKKYSDHNVQPEKTYSYYVTAAVNNVVSGPSNKVEINVVAPVIAYGKISGHLFDDSTNAPVFRGHVDIIPSTSGGHGSSAMTDSNGFFTCKLQTGQYYIYSSAMGYIGEYYDNVPTKLLATVVTLAENDSLVFSIGIKKFVPPPPPVMYSVTGWVKDANSGVLRANLYAYVTNKGHNNPSCTGQYFSKTDSLGNFKFMVKAGDTVVVYCAPFNQTFKPEYWNNKVTYGEADKIPVNGNVADINITLDPKPVYNNGISGTVKDSAGTLVLKGNVYAYKKLSNGFAGKRYFVKTDTVTGVYTFTNLEPGNYILLASSHGYKSTYYRYDGTPTMNWRQADSVVVTETSITNNIDFRLRSFNHIHGNAVVYGNVQEQMGNVLDAALTLILDNTGELVGCAVSELDGSYQVDGLTAGTYKLVSNMINYRDAEIQNIVIGEMNGTSEVNVILNPDGVTAVDDNSLTVTQFELSQNYPNPFNPSSTISFSIPSSGLVTLKVYDALGKEVAVLLNEVKEPGSYNVKFNAENLSSGIYLYKMQSGNYTATKKMILMK
jgi:hypothetical protein